MTQTCEALSEVTTAELVYCIKHERAVKVETFTRGVGHLQIEEILGETPEVEVCTFPLGYTVCPPPADDGDWAAQEPSLEEREEGERAEEGMWLGGGE